VCPTCTAALDELLAEERLLRAIDLYGQVTAWKCAGLLTTSTAMRLWSVIQPATRATDPSPSKPAESVATPTLAAADTTSQPPRLPFRWRDLGESLLAERTLNTLLGLGAFLILAAALVISVLNPTNVSHLPHVGVVAGTMSLFYAAGYTCHVRMRLTRAGEALLAIAGALVPLGVWVVGGAEGMGWRRSPPPRRLLHRAAGAGE
jgi:hypothetical protein